MALAAVFAAAAFLALLGLCAVAPHAVPRVTGTTAFIVTLAAIAAATLR